MSGNRSPPRENRWSKYLHRRNHSKRMENIYQQIDIRNMLTYPKKYTFHVAPRCQNTGGLQAPHEQAQEC